MTSDRAEFPPRRTVPAPEPAPTQLRRAVWWLFCAVCCGCGMETYEVRLAATQSYYAYLDRLDQNLSQPWRTPPVDVFRPPVQFKEMPAPEGELRPDGTRAMPAVDPRQPDYASFRVDGLIGAWRADVDVVNNNERISKPAFLYVASNTEKFLTDKIEEAVNFTKTFLATLETSVRGEVKSELAATFPKGHQFVARQSFDVNLINTQLNIHGSRYVFEVYSTQQGDNQVVVLLVAPSGMDPASRISERMQLTLETMRVTNQRPQPPQPGQGGTRPGPAPQGGGF